MNRLPSSLTLPLMAGLFVLVVGGLLGVIFSVVGELGTVIVGLSIVFLSPIVAGALVKR